MITYQDIVAAKARIQDYLYLTPQEKSLFLSDEKTKIYLKLESQQRMKSFKTRGAFSKLTNLTEQEKRIGVITVSSGNHGAAVSYAANRLGGIKAKVIIPENTPDAKIEKIKYYGASINIKGKNYDQAHTSAMNFLQKEGLTFIDSCSDREVIAGQGTAGLEILKQNPDTDIILVPIGGGGLITGISTATKQLKPDIKIIGVQTEASPAMIRSLQEHKFYETYPAGPSICEALIGGVGKIPYMMAEQCIDDIIEVKEEMIRKAVYHLISREKVIAEPSGAIGVAALLQNPSLFTGKEVAVVISGGNIDEELLKEILLDEKT